MAPSATATPGVQHRSVQVHVRGQLNTRTTAQHANKKTLVHLLHTWFLRNLAKKGSRISITACTTRRIDQQKGEVVSTESPRDTHTRTHAHAHTHTHCVESMRMNGETHTRGVNGPTDEGSATEWPSNTRGRSHFRSRYRYRHQKGHKKEAAPRPVHRPHQTLSHVPSSKPRVRRVLPFRRSWKAREERTQVRASTS